MKSGQRLLLSIIIMVCLVAIGWGGLKLFYYGKFYPNSRVAGVSVSGMTNQQAKNLLTKKIADFKGQTIWFDFDNQSFAYEIDFDKVDFKIDQSINKAKNQNRLSDIISSDYQVDIKTDRKLKRQVLKYLRGHINQEVVEESIKLDNGEISYQEGQIGRSLNNSQTWNNFVESISSLKNTVSVSFQEDYPSSNNLLGVYNRLSNLLGYTPVKITDQTDNRVVAQITQDDIVNWLSIKNRRDEKCKIKKGCLLLSKMKPITSQATFDNNKINTWVDELAKKVDQKPINATLAFNGKKIVIVKPAKYGYLVDKEELITNINNLLDNPTDTIASSVKVDKPKVRADNLKELGIKELVGRGETTFYGSSSNRIHNVRTGASKISGSLIAPGETYSAAAVIGEVNGKTGYLPEYVIKGKETIKEYGGGLCQVSSTLFRAALNSGFNIVERHPHAYRVSYYEPPIGMDAAIYTPYTDIKFTNNTDHWALIQYEMEGYHLAFNVYGTDDGRKVEISEPKSGNFTNPPKPIIIKDKNLKPGEKVTEERGRAGADAWFKYRVKKDGKYIINQTISSHYQAWPARIKVGPDKKKTNKKNKKKKDEKKN